MRRVLNKVVYGTILALGGLAMGSFKGKTAEDSSNPKTGIVHQDSIKGTIPLGDIRTDHPRIFLNKDMLPEIRAKAQGVLAKDFARLKNEVDELPLDAPAIIDSSLFTLHKDGTIEFKTSGIQGYRVFKYDGGSQAVKSALVYLITGNREYIDKAVNYIKLANHIFQWTADQNIWVDLTGHIRINALTAYDWICSELNTSQRKELLLPMLDYISKSQPDGEYTFRRSRGGPKSGTYGERPLEWFAGLAGYGGGVDDARAEAMLKRGGTLYIDMMEHRENISAGSGLLSAATVTYSFTTYPYSSFHFLHTLRAAFNQDVTNRWKQMLDYPKWFDWATLKLDSRGRTLFHGIGDVAHTDNLAHTTYMYTHMAQVIHLYGERYPEKMDLVYALQDRLPPNRKRIQTSLYPFLPYLLTSFDSSKATNITDTMDYGPYFYNSKFGLLLTRSGKGEDDTYASFRFGADQINHQHYDDLSFTIYKKNFLALDGGSRTSTAHHYNFAPQSVAHNTILIHEPNEDMPHFWKPWGHKPEEKTYYNHGGQYKKDRGVALALHSTDDFIYAAGDGTKNYSEVKSKEVVRQFVYLKPDIFVIYDRVASVNAEQKKEFLIRFQEEPVRIEDNQWRADHGGSLFVTTLLPQSPNYNLVGGPGREFEASSRNWELPGGTKWENKYTTTGKWRLEISGSDEDVESRFLNVLQAANSPSVTPVNKELRQTTKHDIVVIQDDEGNKWELSFNKVEKIGLYIKMEDRNGRIKHDKYLENTIEKNK